jgi:hypothetical protein
MEQKPFLTIEFKSYLDGNQTQLFECNVQKWVARTNVEGIDIYCPDSAARSQTAVSLFDLEQAETCVVRDAVERTWLQMGRLLFSELFEGRIPTKEGS